MFSGRVFFFTIERAFILLNREQFKTKKMAYPYCWGGRGKEPMGGAQLHLGQIWLIGLQRVLLEPVLSL
jgi:hypothetical protein